MMLKLMAGLTVYHLRFSVRAHEFTSFGSQPGSAIRGALYQALSRQYCPDTLLTHLPGHQSACPVCWLLATEDPESSRGRNLPRPLTIEPPSPDLLLEGGDEWEFGLTLIGHRALETFPHLVRAVQEMGRTGVGRGRGRFTLIDIESINPLQNSRLCLLNGRRVNNPELPVTATEIKQATGELSKDRLILNLLSPLRIGENKRLSRYPNLGILVRRLLERCQAMVTTFGKANPIAEEQQLWKELTLKLSEVSEQAQLISDQTTWLDVQSGSRRTGNTSPIGGLVGFVEWEGDFSEILPWVLWGQSIHVGKSTVKGNGWYEVLKG